MTRNSNKTFFWLLYSCNTIFGAARKYLLVDHVLVMYIFNTLTGLLRVHNPKNVLWVRSCIYLYYSQSKIFCLCTGCGYEFVRYFKYFLTFNLYAIVAEILHDLKQPYTEHDINENH